MSNTEVRLRGGFSLDREAFLLARVLEDRHIKLVVDRSGRLKVEPRAAVTQAEKVLIKKHTLDLIALVRYVEIVGNNIAMLGSPEPHEVIP